MKQDPVNTDRYKVEHQQLARRNYWAHSIEGGVYIGGLAFLAADTILPPMVQALGGSNWLVAIVPILGMFGALLPPLFTAHRVERMPHILPLLYVTGVLQRIPYLFTGLALLFLSEEYPALVLVLVGLTPLLSGIALGVSYGAWMAMVGKLIPRSRLASSWAIRHVITACIGLVAGWGVNEVLQRYPGTTGFGILHLIAFTFLTVSYLIFIQIREPREHPPWKLQTRSLRDNLRELPGILRTDRQFLSYVLARVFYFGIYVVVPFMSIHALQRLDRPASYLGTLLIAKMAGGLIGNLIGGYWGDRYGGRKLMLGARLLFLAVFVGLPLCDSGMSFLLIFAAYGLAFNLDKVGSNTLILELCPRARRPTYVSLLGILCLPGMLTAPLFSAWLRGEMQGITVAASVAGVCVALSLLSLRRIDKDKGSGSTTSLS